MSRLFADVIGRCLQNFVRIVRSAHLVGVYVRLAVFEPPCILGACNFSSRFTGDLNLIAPDGYAVREFFFQRPLDGSCPVLLRNARKNVLFNRNNGLSLFIPSDGIFHLRLLSARDLPLYGRGLSEQLDGRVLAAHALFPRSGFKNGLPERFPRPDQRLVVFCLRAACLLGFASG